MWIIKVALNRLYSFIVLALLILLISPVVIHRMPADIFPNINIPVIAVSRTYTGLNPEEMEGRITTVYERVLTTLVDNIEHIESTTVNGTSVVKIFLQPNASIDTANAQVTAASQTILRQLPAGTQPPLIINYSASSVPILQLALSGKGLSEPQLNDLALNFLRPQLVTVPGAAVPYPYGGKQRQVMVSLNPQLLQSKGLSPSDIVSAVNLQNIVLPSGTAKIDKFEYDIDLNAAPHNVAELNDLPLKVVNGATVYLRDVAQVSDGFAPQTNIVRQDGRRSALVTVLKAGNASTIDVVNGVRKLLPRVETTLPPQLKIQPLGDQSVFVRAAVNGVIREAIIAACLTGVMILIFLGSWRSTLIIAVSIPLSILTSVIVLGFLGETLNVMTFGGWALAVGILVDDATVTIENIERYLEQGSDLKEAIMEGAGQIAVPVLVSTLCICIVFLPMFFLSGVARYLFVPLAEAVVFAMLASYILSRTLVPTLDVYLLRAKHHAGSSRNPFVWFQRGFEHAFERLRLAYELTLTTLVYRRYIFVPAFLGLCLAAFTLVPWLGQDFFPNTDSGQFILHLRAKTGTRIEETARLSDQVENSIRRKIPSTEVSNILDNIGLPYSQLNYMRSTSGLVGTADADIFVSLNERHHPTADYVRDLRRKLPGEFPGVTFYMLPADITTQILNFGLPAPVDVQIDGADVENNRAVADRMLEQIRRVPGVVDARLQQEFDYPKFHIAIDRTKAVEGGYTPRDVANSLLVSLSGSFQTAPTFFLNWQNGVNYNLVEQTPQYSIQSLQDLPNIPITSAMATRPEILADVASITRSNEMEVLNHYNIRRVVDIYAAVQDRDLGGAGREIQSIVDSNRHLLPRGSFVIIRGQLDTMRTSYVGLLAGLGFAIILIYLLIVVNFQSWLDPFVIITALPAALAGIVLFLFFTRTTISVPALMGSIMCMGVATANSILVVAFARERLSYHSDALQAAIEAGYTRFRPVLMTALAMIIGMIPMALGLGEGGEQNAPLGRAVIGGLLCATVATLVFVPAVSITHPAPAAPLQEIVLPGNTQAFTDSPIYARTNGYLTHWYFDIGTRVRKGDLLAEIETPEIDQQLQQARAQLETAQANYELAKTTADRWQFLLKSNSVSKQETDQAVANQAAQKAVVDSNAANVRRLEQLQSFEKVYAPFDGVITARSTDIGALIDAGSSAQGKELFHLAAISTLRVFVPVPEVYSNAARPGATATLTLDEYPGRVFRGKLVRNSSAIDSASRTLLVEVDVSNPDGLLLPGAYVQVHLKLPATIRSVTVPANTLLFRREGLRVGVVHGGRANLVPVTIGRDYGAKVEIVSGLQPADSIILDPSDSLENSSPVRVQAGGAQ